MLQVDDRVKLLTDNCLWSDRPATVTAVDERKVYPVQVEPDRCFGHRFWFRADELAPVEGGEGE